MAQPSENQKTAVSALRSALKDTGVEYADVIAWKKAAKLVGASVTIQSIVKADLVEEVPVAHGSRIVKVYRPKPEE